MFLQKEDPLSDKALIRAARKRLLSELGPASRKERAAASRQHVINNIYGSGGGAPSGGLMEHLGGSPAAGAEDPFDYMVDITRENNDKGWTKKVHRYRGEKKK